MQINRKHLIENAKENTENEIISLCKKQGFKTHTAIAGVFIKTASSRGWFIYTSGSRLKLYHENTLGFESSKDGFLPYYHLHKELSGSSIADMLCYINNHDYGTHSQTQLTKKEHR